MHTEQNYLVRSDIQQKKLSGFNINQKNYPAFIWTQKIILLSKKNTKPLDIKWAAPYLA